MAEVKAKPRAGKTSEEHRDLLSEMQRLIDEAGIKAKIVVDDAATREWSAHGCDVCTACTCMICV
jgi:hypothetical protein